MRNPGKLEVLERAMELAVLTYRATSTLPASERYNLVDQLRRAATSIGSNISEGCGRSTDAAYLGYLQNAMASAAEVEYQAALTLRLGLGDQAAFHDVLSMTRRVKIMLSRLTAAVRHRHDGTAGPRDSDGAKRRKRP